MRGVHYITSFINLLCLIFSYLMEWCSPLGRKKRFHISSSKSFGDKEAKAKPKEKIITKKAINKAVNYKGPIRNDGTDFMILSKYVDELMGHQGFKNKTELRNTLYRTIWKKTYKEIDLWS